MTASNEDQVKCCACKNQHAENDRLQLPDTEWPGFMVSACPKCKAHEFYRVKKEPQA